MSKERILVIGAGGQLGSELTGKLQDAFGKNAVVATDVKPLAATDGNFELLDVLDTAGLDRLLQKGQFTQIYHLAAVLSAVGEQNPTLAWKINMDGLLNVLEGAVKYKIAKVYWPSSIAVFGSSTPRVNTPQDTIMDPSTVYGISKLAGERWCAWYHKKHGLDVRSLRYPGLIGYKAHPGGGTTDYAVDIFFKALTERRYECFLAPGTYLPMMFMDDALDSTLKLMEAPADQISVRSSYNLGALSFSPEELAREIQVHIPDFSITYKPDFRQQIAESWPQSIDDSVARADWGWKPAYDLKSMVRVMLQKLPEFHSLVETH
jgi:nucleoside-diphosphate-sugar epimerase